jgi:hypothetical protein
VPKSNFFSTSKGDVAGQLSDASDIVVWVTLYAESPLVAIEFEPDAAWAPRFSSSQKINRLNSHSRSHSNTAFVYIFINLPPNQTPRPCAAFCGVFSFWRLTALPPFWPPCLCSLADNLISVDWSKNVPGILTSRLSTTPSAWSSFLLLASSDAAMASAIDVAERQDVIGDHWMPPMSCLSLPAQLAWSVAPPRAHVSPFL